MTAMIIMVHTHAQMHTNIHMHTCTNKYMASSANIISGGSLHGHVLASNYIIILL